MKLNNIVLGDHIQTITDYHANGSYKKLKSKINLKYEPDYAIMIRTLNFEAEDFENDLIYVNKKEYEFLSKSKVYENDIIMNKIANAGSVYVMPKLSKPTTLAMNLFLIRLKDSLDQKFMYYLMNLYEPYIKQFANGTATNTITKDSVKQLKFKVPTINAQKKIANILEKFDKILFNNLRLLSLLEKNLYYSFEEIFLRFKKNNKDLKIDKKTNLPFGWKKVKLTQYISLEKGIEPGRKNYSESKTDQNIPFLRVGDLNKRSSNIYINKTNKITIANNEDVLISFDGSPGQVKSGLNGYYSSGIRNAKSINMNLPKVFIYSLFKSQDIQKLIQSHSSGTTILHAGSSIKRMKFILPDKETLALYDLSETPKYNYILNLKKQN